MASQKSENSAYRPQEIEKKWQKKWREEKTFSPDMSKAKNPFYNLMMFPYPSAEGLHVGNMYAFTGADVYGRFMRMKGYDVFEPIGLDGFGIHSENYALKVGKHPREQASISQKNFYRQLEATGNAYDWRRTLETYDPEYYRWTQWLFIQMFKKGLAYRRKAKVNWCPSDKTVLADEQVIDGKCERDGADVEKRDLEQWFFKITEYADRLLAGLDRIDWPRKVKIAQELWIGRSEDTEIDFSVYETSYKIKIITTRADTVFGATFLVLAPEHELVEKLKSKITNWDEVENYIESAKKKSDFDRTQNKEKTGVELKGIKGVNPVNNEEIPVFIADYVLATYGTGAIMAVPAHDDRDYEFAKKFQLPIKHVIEQPKEAELLRIHVDDRDDSDLAQGLRDMSKPMEYWTPTLRRYDNEIKNAQKIIDLLKLHGVGGEADLRKIEAGSSFELEFKPARIEFGTVYAGDGIHINSEFINGLKNKEAIAKMTEWLSERSLGGKSIHYHLRDWLISRQRYWGPPIPMIFCQDCSDSNRGEREDMAGWYTVPEANLPVELPDVEDWRPEGSGTSPLANHPEFYETNCPGCGAKARRETDVSDTFLDSAWYYLRYLSVGMDNASTIPYDIDIVKKWCPVGIYIGGAEHSVLHLLYVRFVAMLLHDLNSEAKELALPFEEAFPRFFAHGLIVKDGAKMSKSRGNVVVPDAYISKFGADTLRMYLMFLGQFSDGGDFRDSGIEGMSRFVKRVWTLLHEVNVGGEEEETTRMIHKTIKTVTDDISRFSYNTAIARLMEFYNFAKDKKQMSRETIGAYLKMLAPFAPHMTEEVWVRLSESEGDRLQSRQGGSDSGGRTLGSIHFESWPSYEEKYLVEDTVTIAIQVNGKRRGEVEISSEDSSRQENVEPKAREAVAKYLENEPKKVIYIPGKIINFVI